MTHVLGIDIACESFVARLLACQPTVTPVGEGMTFEKLHGRIWQMFVMVAYVRTSSGRNTHCR